MKKWKTIAGIFIFPLWAFSQQYAPSGTSSLIGSLNVHHNPASMVNSPLKWDLVILGLQEKHSANLVKIFDYSLLTDPKKSLYAFPEGRYKRYGELNANLNLLNARLAINRKQSIAVGFNMKSYATFRTSTYNYADTISRFGHFFSLNEGAENMKMNMTSSTWAEWFAAYALTLADNELGRLNAGFTAKLNKGLSGAFASFGRGNFIRTAASGSPQWLVTGAELDFGYSANYDRINNNPGLRRNVSEFLRSPKTGISFDAGVEYMFKLPGTGSQFIDDAYFDYSWKVGISLIDIGFSQYRPGKFSTRARDLRQGITDILLDQTFDSTITALETFRDSLSEVFNTMTSFSEPFRIFHPSRLVIAADRFISGSFFVSAELSLSISSFVAGKNRAVRDMNVLTIAPRWENRLAGVYLPVSINSHQKFWAGAAFRFGPLLLGVHNWSNVFSKKKFDQGGAYLSLILKAADFTPGRPEKGLTCP